MMQLSGKKWYIPPRSVELELYFDKDLLCHRTLESIPTA